MRLLSEPGSIDKGSVHFGEDAPVDLLSLPEKEMRHFRGNRISMIFQEPMTSLNPVFTCGFQVDEALMLHKKISRKQAKQKHCDCLNRCSCRIRNASTKLIRMN